MCDLGRMRLLLIALGGGLGTAARYGLTLLLRRFTTEWPAGTLAANVLGCFVLGVLTEVVLRGTRMSEDVRLMISVGFCGGLTTYSSFNQEALLLLRTTGGLWGVAYFAATVALCAAASLLGLLAARALA
jgi:fluoride exporter